MLATDETSLRYAGKFIVVAFALPILPGWPLLVLPEHPSPAISIAYGAYVLVALVGWGFLARRLLAKARYTCPRCSQKVARFERRNDAELWLVCDACGFCDKSNDVAGNDSGG